jgi:hypothetical protein
MTFLVIKVQDAYRYLDSIERLLRGMAKIEEANLIMKTRKHLLFILAKMVEEEFTQNTNNIVNMPVHFLILWT